MMQPNSDLNQRTSEWQTWLLIACVHVIWLTLITHYNSLPGAALLLIVINACHGSMQHELIHGHPTRHTSLNSLLAYAPLSLWYPYPLYRKSHIRHHNDDIITLPGLDPESFYVSRSHWEQAGSVQRAILVFNMTLAGRMLIGPAITFAQLCRQAYRAFRSGDRATSWAWSVHYALVFLLLYALAHYAGIPAWQYIIIAYFSQSLGMLRSFYEHRAVPEEKQRSVLVEASWPMRLLFANNNYHLLHHNQPELAWYKLPTAYQAQRSKLAQENAGFVVKGYRQWWINNLFRAVDHPRHPFYPTVSSKQ
jgi:fatty acid desaturase